MGRFILTLPVFDVFFFFMGLGLITVDDLIKERDIHFFIAFLLLIYSFFPISSSPVFFQSSVNLFFIDNF